MLGRFTVPNIESRCNQLKLGHPPEMRHSRETSLSDAGVPGVAAFGRRGAQTLAKLFQTVSDSQVGDEFHALVAELAGEPHAKRPAVAHGKFTAIHAIGEKSLRMQCIAPTQAFPPHAL